ncbi:MAG TPA: polysaccharide biosynthesis/export family protein [Anaeromyxobacteraceae bacterium]|nr:polysaccharide biosynthesis/export family protein [Anaeromyxobacteraceae bacterium]
MSKKALTLLALFASGCALAPGMKMDESSAEARGRTTTNDPEFKVEQITPPLVAKVVSEKFQPPTLPDPFAAEASNYQYRVAPRDVLSVVVWDHPELTTPSGTFRSPEENGSVVNPDGSMFYPHAGIMHVGGLTVEEIRRALSERLARVIRDPQVKVTVAAFRGRRMQVTGEVMKPTTVAITDIALRAQDAIAMAGGPTTEADWSNVQLSRGGKVYRLDLQAYYERGDVTQNWLLKDGDVLNLGDRQRNKVFIIGEVKAPHSQLMIKGRMNLAEALVDATGGWDFALANSAKIYVIRGDYTAPNIFRLDAESPDAILLASQFPLRPRDVVFVSTLEIARFNRAISQILPTINMFWQLYDIGAGVQNAARTGTFGNTVIP